MEPGEAASCGSWNRAAYPIGAGVAGEPVCFWSPSKEHVSFNFMAAVTVPSDLEPKKIKSVTVSIVSPSICHEVMGCHDFSFLNAVF